MTRAIAVCLALVLLTTTMTGCFSPDADEELIASDNLTITPDILVGANFQTVEFSTSSSMSVHVPYLVLDPDSGYVVNGTTLNFDGSGTASIEMLAPSNTNSTYFLLGALGREEWPLRATNQSWHEWFHSSEFEQSPYTFVEHSVLRENDSAYTIEDGALHSTGLIDGRNVFEWLELFAPTKISGVIVRLSDAMSSSSASGEKHPVMVVVSRTRARHAAIARVISSDWC